jgi:P-type E1-E2 ATPase
VPLLRGRDLARGRALRRRPGLRWHAAARAAGPRPLPGLRGERLAPPGSGLRPPAPPPHGAAGAGAQGLTSAEAAARLAARPRRPRARGSRSYGAIVWSNTATLFNAILGALLALTFALGDPRDALFGGVIVANTLIGIVQELRAKRVLDRLALLVAPHARVRRDGALTELPADGLVPGDVVRLEPGDQVVADGRVIDSRGLTIDESILTGESDPVSRDAGEGILSGSYCLAGAGEYLVEAVGADSFAERLAVEARGTRAALSPLQLDINRVLWLTVGAMVPLAIGLVLSLWVSGSSLTDAAPTIVAALVPLVPEGLVLLTSLTFAVAAVRLARLGTLAQRLNAVESLASVDTVCLDKTGTLTENRLRVLGVEPAPGHEEAEVRGSLAALAAGAGAPNATTRAIAEWAPGPPRPALAEVPFSSARKWSAVTLEGEGTLVLGATDVLARDGVPVDHALRARVAAHAAEGHRVVLLAGSDVPLDGRERLPAGSRPLGLVVLGEAVRPDAADTLAFLTREGVRTRVISGDDPVTVAAIARATGVPGAERAIGGADLPPDGPALEEVAERTAVYGRVSPEQKRDLVRAMTRRGRYVAMTGDGVNDVLALKEARLGIAMGNGSQMAKGVADIVLLSNLFATVPRAIDEGRRILRNTHRVAKLFVAKSVYSAVILATVGLMPIAYPFLPRHVTVASTLTIGVPAFFLALAPSQGPVRREGFLRTLLAFALPAGIVSGLTIDAAYLLARGPLDAGVTEARTAAVLVTTGMGLAIVIEVERGLERRPVRPWVWGMVAAFAGALVAGLQVPFLRDFFAAEVPSADVWLLAAGCIAAGAALLVSVRRVPWLARMEAGAS